MRRVGLILAVMVIGTLGAAAPAMAQNQLVGVLVDLACSNNLGITAATDPAHTKCAIRCAERGQRLALLNKNGRLYAITGPLAENNNAALRPLIGVPDVRLDGVISQGYIEDQTTTLTSDGRRGTVSGVVQKYPRKGNFREGDSHNQQMYIYSVTTILSPVPAPAPTGDPVAPPAQ